MEEATGIGATTTTDATAAILPTPAAALGSAATAIPAELPTTEPLAASAAAAAIAVPVVGSRCSAPAVDPGVSSTNGVRTEKRDEENVQNRIASAPLSGPRVLERENTHFITHGGPATSRMHSPVKHKNNGPQLLGGGEARIPTPHYPIITTNLPIVIQ